MGKLEKLEKLQKLKESGVLTEEEFNAEKEKLMKKEGKNSKKTVIIVVLILVVLIAVGGVCAYYFMNKGNSNDTNTNSGEQGFEQTSANVETSNVEAVSFENMSGDDEGLNEVQKSIVNYFDNDYFKIYDIEELQRYPQVFKDSKVEIGFIVKKVLKSTDEEFEAVVASVNTDFYTEEYTGVNLSDIPKEELFVIKGKQMQKRLLEDDLGIIYGRYVDVEEYNVDGVTYTLPTIRMINDIIQGHRYDINTIKIVAEYIFGNDIKVTEPSEEDYIVLAEHLPKGFQSFAYRVTLDNQSNANFKVFDMDVDEGGIYYDYKYNDLSENIVKKLFISSDFEHYIVTTYDSQQKHAYLEYFDKQYNKLWSREFDYNSNNIQNTSPLDYNTSQLAIVVDNDLYLIDLETGEDIIEPVTVGDKLKINMMSDGIVLIGNDNKDTIMKVGYDGETIFKTNGNVQMEEIYFVNTQIVNGKLVVSLSGSNSEGFSGEQYLVVNNDGTLEISTDI